MEAVVEGLDTYRGHQVKVLAKNEHYLVRYLEVGGATPTDGAVLASTPDLICVVDSDTGRSNKYRTTKHNTTYILVLYYSTYHLVSLVARLSPMHDIDA